MVISEMSILDFVSLYQDKNCVVNILAYDDEMQYAETNSILNYTVKEFIKKYTNEDDLYTDYSIFSKSIKKIEVLTVNEKYYINILIEFY